MTTSVDDLCLFGKTIHDCVLKRSSLRLIKLRSIILCMQCVQRRIAMNCVHVLHIVYIYYLSTIIWRGVGISKPSAIDQTILCKFIYFKLYEMVLIIQTFRG